MRFYSFFFGLFLVFSCNQSSNSSSQLVKSNNLSKVFFKNINNGDTLSSPFLVEMGVSSMKIKPAGQLESGTGHHHILVNRDFMKYGEIIPMDNQHLHYGKGDTVVSLSLPPGEYGPGSANSQYEIHCEDHGEHDGHDHK